MATSKSVIVTGGGTGIGAAVAAALHRNSYGVTLVGRRPDVLEQTAKELSEDGTPPVRCHSIDLAGEHAASEVVGGHVAAFGGVDAVVTAAAAYEPVHVLDLTAEKWDSTIDVALRSSVLIAAQAARVMKAARGGRIVLFSSINGAHSEPDSLHYSAAKAAIASVVKSFAVDLAGSGVVTNAVAPGWVYTPMTAEFIDQTTEDQMRRVNTLGRAGRPDEIANVVRYLVMDAPEFLVGSTIYVDGGQTAQAPMP